MKYKVFCILLPIVLAGCQQKSANTGEFIEIDISKNYLKKEIHLQSIADIEYVPLETTNDVLVGGNAKLSFVSDKYIFLWDRRGDIFVFNRSGKTISHFNRKGNGDKEYTGISSVVFDEKNEEIFVFQDFSLSRILVYSLFGEYKRTLKIPDYISRMTAYDFDDETLLIYDESGLNQNTYSHNPYMFMSKKDGSVVSVLNIDLPVRYSDTMFSNGSTPDGREVIRPIRIGIPNNRHFGQDFVIADISSDTIYLLSKSKILTPLLVRKPSVHSSDPRIVWTSQLKTDRFMLLWKIILDFVELGKNQKVSYTNLIYNLETQQTNTVSFVDDDFLSWNLIMDATDLAAPKNMYAGLIDAGLLKNAYEDNKLSGDLKKLAQSIDSEDNQVVMIVKFK